MKKLFLLTLLAILGTSILAWGESIDFKQTRVNIKIRVLNFTDASADLRELVAGFDGQIRNLNLDHNTTSGSSSLRISHSELPIFLEKLALLGGVESQSQHTSDNSSSAREARLKTRAFKTLAAADTKSMFSGMDAETKSVVLADYENWVRGRLSGSISSLKNYDEMALRAQVDINFIKDEATTEVPDDSSSEVAFAREEQAKLSCGASAPRQSPAIYVLCLMNFLGLWLIYRRVEGPIARLHD